MRRSILAICFLVGVSCHPAATEHTTRDELVAAFVAALNADDLNQLERTLHPACRALISGPTQAYYEDLLEKDLSYTIPTQHAVSYSSVPEEQTLPFAQQFNYPARPTDSMTIQFRSDRYSSVSIIRWIRQDELGWHLVLPHPKQGTLAILAEQRVRKQELQLRADALVQSIAPELRSKIEEQLKAGQMLDAIDEYSIATGESTELAVSVVQRIKATKGSKYRLDD